MSAFVVSKTHIDALLTAGLDLAPRLSPLRWLSPAEPVPGTHEPGEPWGPAAIVEYNRRGQRLTPGPAGRGGGPLPAENQRSVNHRYIEHEAEEPYVFERYRRPLKPVEVLKALACYEYQSCEHAEWQSREAKAFCDALRLEATHHLPGYDEAAGSIR